MGFSAYLEEQLRPESIADAEVEEKVAGLKTIRLSSGELFNLYPPPKLGQERSMARRMPMPGPRIVIFELQQARLLRAVYSRRQLYEVMVDFWSNHFNIFAAKGADRWLVPPMIAIPFGPMRWGNLKISCAPRRKARQCFTILTTG